MVLIQKWPEAHVSKNLQTQINAFLNIVCLSSERWTNKEEIDEKNQIPIKIKSIYQNIFSMQN